MSLTARFRRDERGGIAIMFALILLPLILAIGVAIDYSRAAAARTQLHMALDAAALTAAREAASTPDDKILKARALAILKANFKVAGDDMDPVFDLKRTDKKIFVTAEARVPAGFMSLFSQDSISVSAQTEATWGLKKIELALVLDNTGSMSSRNKMTELKKASKDLLNILKTASPEKGVIRVSVVPFATQVRMDTAFVNKKAIIEFNPAGMNPGDKVNEYSWAGCLTDRDKSYDVDDTAPDPVKGRATLYPAMRCVTNIARVQPLTDDFAKLETVIDSMVATGNTNITIGVAHGLATLSPHQPYTGAAAFGTEDLEKFMIVLTDGDNTQNRFGDSGSVIDDRTRRACNSVKNQKVRLYTIRVIEGDAGLLRSCATSSEMFYDVKSASELSPVFQKIAQEIASLRLTQ
ncbi:pilus assembly protein TadG-related protein [Chelatococcus sp. SYSU_G07232]|uniref:Pilus assembly protein TadG-related protein n=1 Tax=Chelatococcus albus TaxID=3047466 RepID=A0ABT7AJL7_9HYPH|nr:pilus assembly protein TadG-related protein [Chelatococcus sp. SYSU_G07232]MDJ1159573.1 pilus assembly protein TadG-related protein [Chelatococcus sp. SYSU_G07232]